MTCSERESSADGTVSLEGLPRGDGRLALVTGVYGVRGWPPGPRAAGRRLPGCARSARHSRPAAWAALVRADVETASWADANEALEQIR